MFYMYLFPIPVLSYIICYSGLTQHTQHFHAFVWNTLSTLPCLVNYISTWDSVQSATFPVRLFWMSTDATGPVSLLFHLRMLVALITGWYIIWLSGLSGSLCYNLIKDKDPILIISVSSVPKNIWPMDVSACVEQQKTNSFILVIWKAFALPPQSFILTQANVNLAS